jgi:hypothetical protein
MGDDMTYKAKGKTFLTDHPEEFGSVSWYVRINPHWMSGDKFIASELRLSDCSKDITLDFNCNTPSETKKRMDKLDTLISELMDFKLSLQKASEKLKPAKVY